LRAGESSAAPVHPLLFALRESHALALEIGHAAGVELAELEERRFEGGEFKLRPLTAVRNRTVFVVQSLAGTPDAPVAQRTLRLLFLLFGLRDAGAAHLIALIPYLAFARKDRRTQARDPVNSRYVAQLLEAAGIDRLVALDVHNPAALDNAFRVPVDHLSAIPMFVDHFAARLAAAPLTVASPDVGGIKRTQIFGELLERRLGCDVELAFIEKRRTRGVVASGRVIGAVRDREVVILDDLCASGGTLVRAATALREAGAVTVQVAFTHAPLEQGLDALTAAPAISRIVCTDSVGRTPHDQAAPSAQDRLSVLGIAPLFAEAVRRMLTGKPLAPLLDGWPPADGG
jgi:ribose-phosphate pyrophosphokinase